MYYFVCVCVYVVGFNCVPECLTPHALLTLVAREGWDTVLQALGQGGLWVSTWLVCVRRGLGGQLDN